MCLARQPPLEAVHLSMSELNAVAPTRTLSPSTTVSVRPHVPARAVVVLTYWTEFRIGAYVILIVSLTSGLRRPKSSLPDRYSFRSPSMSVPDGGYRDGWSALNSPSGVGLARAVVARRHMRT